MRETLYENAIKACDLIYEKSKKEPEYDLYRIKDILDFLKQTQFQSKEWLVEELSPFITSKRKIVLLGGWYGLIAFLLSEKGFQNQIRNIEIDPCAKKISNSLLNGLVGDYKVLERDIFDYIEETRNENTLIVSTSIEHFYPDEVEYILQAKHKDSTVCFQSNNMIDATSHVNCHESEDHFVESLGLNEVFFKGTLELEKYERYMVIGK